MKQVEFSLKMNTATFIHGANSRNAAELRPPSIKGIMRYWFRALAGAYLEGQDLHKVEASFFGSSAGDAQEVGSKLIVRCIPLIATDRKLLLPHKPRDNEKSPSPAMLTSSNFVITLKAFPGLDKQTQEKVLSLASASLWTAINLGGFGQRARRGAGSWQLLEINPNLLELPIDDFESLAQLKNYLEQGLQLVRETIKDGCSNVSDKKPSFNIDSPIAPVLSEKTATIGLVKLQANNEEVARAEIMRELQGFKNPVFGLPYQIPAKGDISIGGRHASPLHLHLAKLKNNNFILVQTLMLSKSAVRQNDSSFDKSKLFNYLDNAHSGQEKAGVKLYDN